MASGLPDPTTQPSFQIASGGEVQRNPKGFPCEVRDYVINPGNWANDIAVTSQRTVRGVLGYQNGVWPRSCFVCEQDPSQCGGGTCVQRWLRNRQRPDHRGLFEIRQTQDMGLGVFAGQDIVEGEVLDEYHGELIPPRMAAARNDDDYILAIGGVASSSARDYGNWTRFVNHRCRDFNVEALEDVLGGRRTVTYRAFRKISRGDQLVLNYGNSYFGDAANHLLCQCPSFPGPHLPPNQQNSVPEDQQAFPAPQEQPNFTTPPDVTIRQKNAWINDNKAWLGQREPNGHSRWTKVHWRLLEQLIRRRHHNDDWRSEAVFGNQPSSKGHPLIASDHEVRNKTETESVSMKIFEWHLDVAKAFQRDWVCGKRQGKEWDTNDLMKRIFAVIVAARRRRRRSGRKNSFARTPPSTPDAQKTAPGAIPTPPTTVRQAKRASRRGRRHQRRSYSP